MLHFLCSCSYLFTFLISSQFYWHIGLKSTSYFWLTLYTYVKYFTALQCRQLFIAISVLLYILYKSILIADMIVVNFNPNIKYVCVFIYFTGHLKHLPKFIFNILMVINISLLSPPKRGIMFLPALVCLSVCLFLCYYDN